MVIAVFWGVVEQNRALKASLVVLSTPPMDNSLVLGGPFPELEAVDVLGKGNDDLSKIQDRGGVVAFLNTTCEFCKQTLSAWTALAEELGEDEVVFVGVSLHGAEVTTQYVRENQLGWPIASLTTRAKGTFRIRGIPTTVLVSPGGAILLSWTGALAEPDLREIRARKR